jgi:integrase
MHKLRAIDGIEARALEFLILTAARMQEARRARFDEIEGNTWTVPAERMKARRTHRVPLSDAALDIVPNMGKSSRGPFNFPGRGAPIGKSSLQRVLFDLVGNRATAHGMRSTFRDWVAEATEFPGEWAELSLAHRVGTGAELAYRRGEFARSRTRQQTDRARAFRMVGKACAQRSSGA